MLDHLFAWLQQAPALLKIVIFFAVWVVVWLPIALPLSRQLKWRPPQPITPAQKLPLLASLYLLAPLVLWGAAWLEQRSFADYGLPWKAAVFADAAVGLGLGALGLLGLFGLQWAFGWLQVQIGASAQQIATTLGLTLLLGLWVSLTEELIFRGFLLNQLSLVCPAWQAATFSSAIFAVLHLVWEGRENLPQLPGLWLMGMVLVLARWVDAGELGLAWGLHAGWIWTIASIDTLQLVRYTGQGPAWLSGLGNQPLAGLLGIVFLGLTGLSIWGLL